MSVAVRIFNSNNLPVNVMINNGTSFQIAAAEGPKWEPQATALGAVAFTPGPPVSGDFGIGVNNVSLTPKGATAPFIAQIPLPADVNWASIQIYIFFQSYMSCSWVVLNNGQVVANAFVLSNATTSPATK